eukprot:s216_g25.t1
MYCRFESPAFQADAVEGWWLDSLLKSGKLARPTYLKLAARVTIGFQKRLADCRAAERYLHDQALRDAVQADARCLQSAMLPMKAFPVVEEKGCQLLAF